MGVAMLLPSLSIGSVALIFGQYKKILLLTNHILRFRIGPEYISSKDAKYIVTLSTTILITVFLLSQLISQFIDQYPILFETVYISLILSSSLYLITINGSRDTASFLAVLAGSASFGALLLALSMLHVAIPVPLTTFIAGFAMVLPGISGSFMLYTFQSYTTVINLLSSPIQHIWSIIGLGITIGLGAFSALKLVKSFLETYGNNLILFFSGVLLSGLITVSPLVYVQQPLYILLAVFLTTVFYTGLQHTQI